MGGELVTASPPGSYAHFFRQAFPYYLSIGMDEEQFWDKDCDLTRAYRMAQSLKNERTNRECWLTGCYVYDAILSASPLLHAFAKKGTKAHPYHKEPYPMTEKPRGKAMEEPDDQTKENERLRAILYFQNWARAQEKKQKES